MRWLLNGILQDLLNPDYGNVVFSRSKLHARCKSLVFFHSLLLPAVANLSFCGCFFWCFLHLFVILCLCAAVCGREFLSRVDIWMQFYGVFWEPFMGMSCFFVQKWMRIINVSCFSVHFCSHLSLIPCFVCICLHILQIFVCFCVGCCSLWHADPESSLSFNAFFTLFSESRLWECRVFTVFADKCVMF